MTPDTKNSFIGGPVSITRNVIIARSQDLETPCSLAATGKCLYISYLQPATKSKASRVSFSLLCMYNTMAVWLYFYILKYDNF